MGTHCSRKYHLTDWPCVVRLPISGGAAASPTLYTFFSDMRLVSSGHKLDSKHRAVYVAIRPKFSPNY